MEKAAKGAQEHYIYPWGDSWIGNPANWDTVTTLETDSSSQPLPRVNFDGRNHGGYQTENNRSPYGLYDMAGNALEWVNDWYDNRITERSPGVGSPRAGDRDYALDEVAPGTPRLRSANGISRFFGPVWIFTPRFSLFEMQR